MGHINVASGFGPFPEIYDYLIPERSMSRMRLSDDYPHFLNYAL